MDVVESGTDDGGFALGTVGDHDDLLQHVGLRHELDADVGLIAHGYFLVGVADEARDKDVAGLHVDGEAAVHVGHRAAGLALDGHEGAGDRGAGLVEDDAGHLLPLPEGQGGHEQAQEEEQGASDGNG